MELFRNVYKPFMMFTKSVSAHLEAIELSNDLFYYWFQHIVYFNGRFPGVVLPLH